MKINIFIILIVFFLINENIFADEYFQSYETQVYGFENIIGDEYFQKYKKEDYTNKFFQPYRTQDYAIEIIYLVCLYIDWRQTKIFIEDEDLYETNVFLGSNPTQERTDQLIGLSAVAHILGVYMMPVKFRTLFQVILLGFEIDAITTNHRNSVKFNMYFNF